MHEEITKQLVELVTRDHEMGGIIMTPPQMNRLLKDVPVHKMTKADEGSGWAYEGVPIYRSWEIVGPCVVSRQVLALLRREVRGYTEFSGDTPKRVQHDLLF